MTTKLNCETPVKLRRHKDDFGRDRWNVQQYGQTICWLGFKFKNTWDEEVPNATLEDMGNQKTINDSWYQLIKNNKNNDQSDLTYFMGADTGLYREWSRCLLLLCAGLIFHKSYKVFKSYKKRGSQKRILKWSATSNLHVSFALTLQHTARWKSKSRLEIHLFY